MSEETKKLHQLFEIAEQNGWVREFPLGFLSANTLDYVFDTELTPIEGYGVEIQIETEDAHNLDFIVGYWETYLISFIEGLEIALNKELVNNKSELNDLRKKFYLDYFNTPSSERINVLFDTYSDLVTMS